MALKNLDLTADDLDTLIDLATTEFEAIGRGEISYGSRDVDLAEAGHLADIIYRLKNLRDE